jgi:hypothetical protein
MNGKGRSFSAYPMGYGMGGVLFFEVSFVFPWNILVSGLEKENGAFMTFMTVVSILAIHGGGR